MTILATIFIIWLIVALALIPYNSKWGVTLFLAYIFLVPVLWIQIGPISISDRVIYLILAILLLSKNFHRLAEIDYMRFAPIAFLILAQGMLIPLQEEVPTGYALSAFFSDLLSQLVFPLMIFLLVLLEDDAWWIFKRTILICGAVFVGYGLYLTTMPGVNPYLMITLPIFGQEFNEAYALGYSGVATSYSSYVADGRLFGRISSVFTHPMAYTLNLGFYSLFISYLFRKKIAWLCTFIIIIVIAIFTSGVRTSFAALGLTIVLSLIYLRNFKYAFWIGTGSVLLLTSIFYLFPNMQEYVLSIIDSTGGSIKGSSAEMRLDQFDGCFNIIKDCALTGKGYNWTSLYVADHGPHPIMLCFESLAFMVLCNSGIIGALIWIIFVCWMIYDIHGFANRNARALLFALFLFFLIFALATGNYGYMRYFAIYYAIALGFCYHTDEEGEEDEEGVDYEEFEEENPANNIELRQ